MEKDYFRLAEKIMADIDELKLLLDGTKSMHQFTYSVNGEEVTITMLNAGDEYKKGRLGRYRDFITAELKIAEEAFKKL